MNHDEKIISYKNQRCPMYKNVSKHPFIPFCSKRCAMIDLNKWLSESYKVSTLEINEQDNEENNIE